MSGRGRGRDMVLPAWMKNKPPPHDDARRTSYSDSRPAASNPSSGGWPDSSASDDQVGDLIGRWVVCLDRSSGVLYYYDVS